MRRPSGCSSLHSILVAPFDRKIVHRRLWCSLLCLLMITASSSLLITIPQHFALPARHELPSNVDSETTAQATRALASGRRCVVRRGCADAVPIGSEDQVDLRNELAGPVLLETPARNAVALQSVPTDFLQLSLWWGDTSNRELPQNP